MPLVTLHDLSIRFRGPPLFENVQCQIEPGQRIGLLGRNGAGKTTLMRIIMGEEEPDHGQVTYAPGVKIAMLTQDVPRDVVSSIEQVVASGLPECEVDQQWKQQEKVARIIDRMELAADAPFENLSSGMKRRVLLAKAIVTEPDLLLLDEPTNHLDIEAIGWLENFLLKFGGAYLFVTHDRMFLRKMATRILEIDGGRLFDWSCDYETFLERKEAALAAQEKQHALFDKRLAEEEAWIRQGIKARRTRNEGRVKALMQMRRDRDDRRQRAGTAKMQLQQGERSGVLVAEAESVSFAYGDNAIVNDFSTTILRGDKVGVVGPNGVGKTTLLRILLGELEPDEGSVRLGTNLQIAYFDQLRQQLDGEATVIDNVADGADTVTVNGKSKHIIGYLQDFLFTPERARSPVRFLSGGERNRVLLARLFAKPANVFVLDEPTNDLDTETLELLEDLLSQFSGTLLLVSHDREFLNNVVGSTIVFEEGGVKEYVGGYDDWVRQSRQAALEAPKEQPAKPAPEKPRKKDQPRKLSYHEQRELQQLPKSIEALEADIAALHEEMADPSYYQGGGEKMAEDQARLAEWEDRLAAAYARWEELEEIASAG